MKTLSIDGIIESPHNIDAIKILNNLEIFLGRESLELLSLNIEDYDVGYVELKITFPIYNDEEDLVYGSFMGFIESNNWIFSNSNEIQ